MTSQTTERPASAIIIPFPLKPASPMNVPDREVRWDVQEYATGAIRLATPQEVQMLYRFEASEWWSRRGFPNRAKNATKIGAVTVIDWQ